ncbi:hypothetical protein PR048_001322 [Dryococelus australis]|uniref:Uncharacterized protein n=1 Tax=Dryococelus australis TaxID=614101 RepID=A0ABQ9IH64_9NEOP|nr:hypothetical protein PR048_001322 [Dryococelus australis]
MRVIEVSMEQRRNERAGKREITEQTRRPTASSGTIPTCENPELSLREKKNPTVTDLICTVQRYDGNTARLARRSDEALDVHVSVARIAPSLLLDLGRGVPTGGPADRSAFAPIDRRPRRTDVVERRHVATPAISATDKALQLRWVAYRRALRDDKIDFKRVYTEFTFAIGSEFIRYALNDSAAIADLQGNKKRISYCQMRGNTGATANEQTSEVKLYKGLWGLVYSSATVTWDLGRSASVREFSPRERKQLYCGGTAGGRGRLQIRLPACQQPVPIVTGFVPPCDVSGGCCTRLVTAVGTASIWKRSSRPTSRLERRRPPLSIARYRRRMVQSALILRLVEGVSAYRSLTRHTPIAATAVLKIHVDSSQFLLQPFHELSKGFWPRLTSPHPAIQFVPKMFYRVEVGALGGPVQSANIVVGQTKLGITQRHSCDAVWDGVQQSPDVVLGQTGPRLLDGVFQIPDTVARQWLVFQLVPHMLIGTWAIRATTRLPPRRTGLNPRMGTPGLSQVEIVPDDVTSERVFSGDLPFPPCHLISSPPHTHLASPSSALRTSIMAAITLRILLTATPGDVQCRITKPTVPGEV